MDKVSKNVKNIIRILKDIDSNIDLARDRFQFDILINVQDDKPFSLSSLSSQLNASRKSLADAIQKMKNKGIVEKLGRDRYRLSEKGLRIKKTIVDLASSKLLSENIYDMFYVARIILILGTLNREWVPVTTLASYFNTTGDKIARIIKENTDEKILKTREGLTGIEVALTFEGRNLYNKLLDDISIGPYTAKVLRILTGTPNIFASLKRFILFNLIAGILTVVFSFITNYVIIVAAVWVIVTLYITILIYSKT